MGVPFRRYAGAVQRRGIPVIAGGRSMQAGFSFTNADERTYFDSDGILQTASAGEARTTYIDGVPYLWLDGAVTEISGRSADLDNWSTSGGAEAVKNAEGLDGESSSGWTCTDDNASSTEFLQTLTSITSGTDTYYAVVAYQHEDALAVAPAFQMVAIDGTQVSQRVVINPATDTLLEETSGGEVILNPVVFGSSRLFVIAITDNASGNARMVNRIYPAWNDSFVTAASASVTGSSVFRYVGLFKNAFSLMPILTTDGTTATVAADVASLANSVISGLTEGTLYMEIWTPQLTSNAARHIAELESDANNFIRVLHAADGDLDAQITDGGVSQAALAGTDLTVGQLQKVALTFKEDEFSLYRDGTRLATDTSGTVPSVDTLLIGAGLYGGIRAMNIYPFWPQAMAEDRTT